MCSEIECAVCYRTYNPGLRCPRELRCKHSFCESCLRTLSRPPGPEHAAPLHHRLICCPLCREHTVLPPEGSVRTELRVDEVVLERLLAAGVLDREDEPEAEVPESPAEEGDSSAGVRGGRPRRSWRKVWRRISGSCQRQGEEAGSKPPAALGSK
ncbi:E3 ubiquitin-protein ligase-like [Nematolebias whitei]|uniref:E3 ubiquitin-protein ligase-like n=1 Tax=Nematolebias whitei TaxID=451745 RepID=UPI001899B4EB|nr:E3 ubiquitin-protein ligase-like [Nematolebias whitei]